MMKHWILIWLSLGVAQAQISGDVLGVHDLSRAGKSPTTGGLPACYYCHAPHSGIGGTTPLWNQKLSNQNYTAYSSTTSPETGQAQPSAGSPSLLCLSCHDGSVAPGQTQAYGSIAMSGSMKSSDILGANLQGSHPTSMVMPLKDSPDLATSITTAHQTMDQSHAIKLVNGNVECTTCHDPHQQSIDTASPNFLVRDSSNGQMCLACHDPNRMMNNQPNKLSQWATSAHALATNGISISSTALGSYKNVGQNACISCHQVHNAPTSSRLLRGAGEQDCILCHGGGTNISPAVPNVFAEFAKGGHPFPSGTNQHDAAEPVLLNQNRHSTCVDCHNAHSSAQVQSFTAPPQIRVSQNNAGGISATDGVSVVSPGAVNQYENCLRCHGTSIGKVANPIYGYLPRWIVSNGDPLNMIPQFAPAATSSHPVTHDRSSPFPQPSLRSYMMNLDGVSYGRSMGIRILCTDCHNSDDNREFGGSGPNGPHGSRFPHIFERRYEFSVASSPGAKITNLYPNPDLSVSGPYALCGKCHDLNSVVSNASFPQHSRHIVADGFSCSTCHTGHGMGALSGMITGERLVNFDANIVAPNGASPISYNRATATCNLLCHAQAHPAPAKPAAPSTTTPALVGNAHK